MRRVGSNSRFDQTNADSLPQKEQDMRTERARKLMATSAAGALGVLLLAAPAFAQGQARGEDRGRLQAGENIRGGSEMRSGGEMRGTGQVRGTRTERDMRVDADTRSNVRTNAESRVRTRADVRTRSEVRVRGNVNTNVRAGIRTDRRQAWNGDVRGRDAGWRYRDRGTSVRVGIGFSDPYYAYGYDDGYYNDGYYAYGAAAEPYAYRGYSSDAHYSYAASPRCTCAPSPYASWNDAGWGWGGDRRGFAAGW